MSLYDEANGPRSPHHTPLELDLLHRHYEAVGRNTLILERDAYKPKPIPKPKQPKPKRAP